MSPVALCVDGVATVSPQHRSRNQVLTGPLYLGYGRLLGKSEGRSHLLAFVIWPVRTFLVPFPGFVVVSENWLEQAALQVAPRSIRLGTGRSHRSSMNHQLISRIYWSDPLSHDMVKVIYVTMVIGSPQSGRRDLTRLGLGKGTRMFQPTKLSSTAAWVRRCEGFQHWEGSV